MADVDEMYDTIMRELNNLVIADETKEEQDRLTFHEDAQDLDDLPPSLLSYFETSKSRAAVCEKLILEEPEDFTEDMMNLTDELNKDVMKPNEKVTENEENNTFTDSRLLPAPTEAEARFTHNVLVCPSNEGEAATNKYIESEKQHENEEEIEKSSELEAETEREQQKRRREREFQEELRKIMEAEKLKQKELELVEKRAQEKLEQEFLLQRELISNLQRRVEEERRMREEEQRRIKAEEDKRKREEERIQIEVERRRMEEETRRKIEEEKKRRVAREEKKKREEERNRTELEKRRLEDEMRMMDEQKRKQKEEEERVKKEENKKREEERIQLEAKRRRMEEETRRQKEEEREKEEEKKRRVEREEKRKRETERNRIESEKKKLEDEMRMMEERIKKEEEERKRIDETRQRADRRRVEEEMRLKKEDERQEKGKNERKKKEEENTRIEGDDREKKEEQEGDRKKITQEKNRDETEHGHKEIKVERKKKEERDEMKTEEEKKEGAMMMKREKQRQQMEEKGVREVGRTQGETRKMEELRLINEEEERNKEDECKTKEEEWRRSQEEKTRREKDEEEMRLEEDKVYEVENRKVEPENKTKDDAKEEEEEEMSEKEKEESKQRMVQEREKEMRTNEVQGQREQSSQLEDKTSSGSESTIPPTNGEPTPQQQQQQDKNINQTSTDQTAGSSTASAFLPVCLPEHTEQKRLSWMKDCRPWSKLSLQNRRKQKGDARSRRGPRRAAEANVLPPLCPDSLLQSTGWRSLHEVTTVTLQDLPGCSLSTLAQCTQLQYLSLRHCGLRSLEGISHLSQLCYIDVQENDISFVDCENMTGLRVLKLGHNKLTSIHGLAGAENLDVLDLSHNSITRIAGLESVRRLQSLSVDHNQLISTKGLRDVYTLLHLNCSHNHLASVEGLENSALLNTLDLRANSLTEPPCLNNQVLLRELHLDDNSISSLQGLTACWLPLMHHLSVGQNSITQLDPMSDAVSLANLDLRFNCMSELQNVCESLEGCHFLQQLHLTGNPLQQESGWRSTLQRALPGLRAIDDRETDSHLSPPAAQQVSLASGSFLTFCQAQLQQTRDLQQQHSRELRNVSSSLDAVKISCQHFAEAVQLAQDQRFAHEYGDTTVADKHEPGGQTVPEETLDRDRTNTEEHNGHREMETTGEALPVSPQGENTRCSYWTFEKSAAESRHDTFDSVMSDPESGPAVSKAHSGRVHSLATTGKTLQSSNLDTVPLSNHQDLDLQNTAAVVIQQLCRKYRQKCGNISSSSTAERGGGRRGDGGEPEPGPSYVNRSQDYAATVIQAFWRGFALRRRLASALAAVTYPDTGEDDTLEEVDVDEFVFDEAALEEYWTLPPCEDSPPRRYPVSERPLCQKPPGPSPPPPPPPPVRRSKQAWVAAEQVERVSPVSSNRSKSPAPAASVVSGLSEQSEKILEEWGFTHSRTALLMLKRAHKMRTKAQQQRKHRVPSIRHALFKSCSNQLGPVEAQNSQAQLKRNDVKVREAERTERVEQERAQQWLHAQAAHPESVRFLPEISSDILNGGRVQLVADPGYTERLHHASGLRANGSLAGQPRKENNYPRRNSLGHAREEVPSPQGASSAPSKNERISFRDNPVQLSGGWGGGKKRVRVSK